MTQPLASGKSARFDLNEIAKSFPPSADTLLLDTYLTNEDAASSRVFRVYRPTGHTTTRPATNICMCCPGAEPFGWRPPRTAARSPGQLLFFRRGVVHALPDIIEGPVVFLSVDTPRRDPRDIIFVNPADGTPESFIRDKSR